MTEMMIGIPTAIPLLAVLLVRNDQSFMAHKMIGPYLDTVLAGSGVLILFKRMQWGMTERTV